jgi:uncharacterized protein YpuA (DUF1002 family)
MDDRADAIWNRAAMENGGVSPEPGDAALAAVLRVHGLAMNSGMLDATERLTAPELDDAESGYRWLGLDEAAEVVEFVRREIADGALDDDNRAESLELEADNRYASLVPQDETLATAFKQRFDEEPGGFAAI